jgi:excisionase family DNA binding protein
MATVAQPIESQFLTRRETADYLKISPKTLSRLTASGELHPYHFGTGNRLSVRYRIGDLNKWAESRAIPSLRRW